MESRKQNLPFQFKFLPQTRCEPSSASGWNGDGGAGDHDADVGGLNLGDGRGVKLDLEASSPSSFYTLRIDDD